MASKPTSSRSRASKKEEEVPLKLKKVKSSYIKGGACSSLICNVVSDYLINQAERFSLENSKQNNVRSDHWCASIKTDDASIDWEAHVHHLIDVTIPKYNIGFVHFGTPHPKIDTATGDHYQKVCCYVQSAGDVGIRKQTVVKMLAGELPGTTFEIWAQPLKLYDEYNETGELTQATLETASGNWVRFCDKYSDLDNHPLGEVGHNKLSHVRSLRKCSNK